MSSTVAISNRQYRPVSGSKLGFPAELIMSILQYAAGGDDDGSGDRDLNVLRAACFVCKSWSPCAQVLLFRTIELPTMSLLRSFRSLIDSRDNGRMFSSAVRCLRIHVDINIGCDIIHPHDMGKILFQLPNLRTLYVNLNNVIEFPLPSLGLLRQSESPIKTLCIVNAYPSQVGAARQLLHRFPTIHTLKFCPVEDSSSNNDEPNPNLVSSGHFNWTDDSHATVAPRLKRLEIPDFKLEFRNFMEECAPALHTLWIGDIPMDSIADAASRVAKCANLKELMLDHLPPPSILSVLPPTLEHLSIADRFMHPHLEFPSIKFTTVALQKSPSLCALTLTQVRDYSDPKIIELKAKCELLGIEFQDDRLPLDPPSATRSPVHSVSDNTWVVQDSKHKSIGLRVFGWFFFLFFSQTFLSLFSGGNVQ
ncbi:hypothetical protein BOTBODRAFT_53263 [Botryobasidium botryosum FD-172 SS1]|uniref:F-box domain-containing protein n=1 Tax=Botryobasidium botryosum (strain FD-172 SS1) TaxID=930990 RepID=A0A067N1S5_BOTB1|nr:hypothetical protein BOTBODRAFT_53263 [Botryobasidium botryosum FD-172 SS1]